MGLTAFVEFSLVRVEARERANVRGVTYSDWVKTFTLRIHNAYTTETTSVLCGTNGSVRSGSALANKLVHNDGAAIETSRSSFKHCSVGLCRD